MHLKNKHKKNYDLDALSSTYPLLKEFVFTNKHNNKTIDFSKPKAVKAINTALLQHHYNITFWDFSNNNLCPPIPGRVDYIYYLSDLITNISKEITVLDIGTGATCIYPLLGNSIYNWSFIATDIDPNSIENAQEIIDKNKLNKHIVLRLQKEKSHILTNIIKENEQFTFSMCNPPFYKSAQEAEDVNLRKTKNLKLDSELRNFSGNANELWYKGGEKAFLHNYLYESTLYKSQFEWFTSLVSKKELIKDLKRSAKKLNIPTFKVIEMTQGNKISRIIAWKF